MKPQFTLNTKGIAILIGAFITTSLALSLYAIFSLFVLKDSVQYSVGFTIISFVLSMGIPIFAFDIFVVKPQTGHSLGFSHKALPTSDYLLFIGMWLGMALISEQATALIPTDSGWLGQQYQEFQQVFSLIKQDKIGMLLLVGIIAPILEEILFRGIIQQGLINKGMPPYTAIILSALIFGIVHANPWQFIGASMLGLVLGWAYYQTQTIVLPILLHALNNLISCFIIFYTDKESISEVFDWSTSLSIITGTLFLILCFYIYNKRKINFN